MNNEDINIHGDGVQIRAWCFVDDFVECIMKCLKSDKAVGESFNIGNSRAVITILGLANLVCRVLNSQSKIVHKDPLSADVEIRVPSLDKAEKILGFNAKTSLEEALDEIIPWVVNQVQVGEM